MRRTALAIILLMVAGSTAGQQPTREQPLPLDPLTPAERERAVSIARADERVTPFLRGRTRLIYAEFLAVKLSAALTSEPAARHADVLFYGYDSNTGLRALVNLEAGKVVDIARVSGTSVPLTADEITEAANLALESSAVNRLLGERARTFRPRSPESRERGGDVIEGLRTLGSGPNDPCSRGRCVMLFFRSENRYLFMHQVVVNLTTRRVDVRNAPSPSLRHDH